MSKVYCGCGCCCGCMPSHTVALTDAQYQYILATKEESVSQRVRELVKKGIKVEE